MLKILKSDPEFVELKNFLIERTRDAKSPMNLVQLSKEFKHESGSSDVIGRVLSRIHTFRLKINQMDSIDTATKVTLLFALNVPIDTSYLKELQKQADVEVDGYNRITKYRAKDGSLELEVKPIFQQKTPSNDTDDGKNDPESIELMDFLIERTKDSKPPLTLRHLAEEFQEKSGSSQGLSSLINRIFALHPKIRESDSIDTAAKVKMLFAMSAYVDEDFLKELRKNANVEIDEKHRITKYKAKDGSLELEGDHRHYAKVKEIWRPEMIGNEKMASLPKTSGSVKRAAPEVPNSSKRAKGSSPSRSMKSEDHAPDDSSRVPESRARQHVRGFSPLPLNPRVQQLLQPKKQRKTGSKKSQNGSDNKTLSSIQKNPESEKRSAVEATNASKRAKDPPPDDSLAESPETRIRGLVRGFSPQPPNPKVQQILQPEEQGALKAPATRARQDAPIFRNCAAPIAPGAHVPRATPIEIESGADDAYTPQVKFLEVIQSLVLNLDMPSLSPLQAKIEKRIRESSSNERIANDEIILAIEALVTKVANRSVLNLSENVESISLKEFLCYLKAAILNSNMEGLENLLEKIRKRIREPTSKDKNIPAEKVASALQYALDGISF